ncbi:tyrosine-protein phosphatase corkscrew-like isoform X2 [Dysidea avara]|uniref:tyrosine-protein phosphatase corkscrew-like isoform X2 n=1 Tax=Dysidea avara TaxID=196820 RepID=UPI00331A0277
MDTRCYHPCVSGAEAEQQLKACKEHGSFLFRNSREDANTYTLSILNDNEVIHLRMKRDGRQFSLCDGEPFESPYDVLHYHFSNHGTLRDKSGRVYYLGKPLIREVLFSARWYHADIGSDGVEALLKRRGQDGSFLVRGSYSTPGDYSLCVRLKDEVVNVKIYGRGEKFDLGAGTQFGSIEDLIKYYKKNPFNIAGGKQVHLCQAIECTAGSTSRQTNSTDGAAMSCYRTIQRYVVPMLPQLELDGRQLQSGTCQEYSTSGPGSWECKGIVTLDVVHSSDTKCDGLIAICDGTNGYSLNLHGTDKDDIKAWFTLSTKIVFSPSQSHPTYTVSRLESNCHPGNYLCWTPDHKRIAFTTNSESQNVNWYKIKTITDNCVSQILLQAATENLPPEEYTSSWHYLTFYENAQPELTPAKSSASIIDLTKK